jgi:hypothetical protein
VHQNLQVIYKHNKPYGIRDENGYLFFFADISKYSGQEDRYRQEVYEQYALADYLLGALANRPNNAMQPTGATAAANGELSTGG